MPPTATPTASAVRRIDAQLRELEDARLDGALRISRDVALQITHPHKVLFPESGVTKGELMRYYTRVAPLVLPLLRGRPLSLKRYPEGIDAEFFFQQKAPSNPPRGVRVETVEGERGDDQERLIGGTLVTLLYCVQLGAFECNPWHARIPSLANPDYAVIDLDPGPRAPFERVVETALWVHEALDARGLHGLAKTSGATGIHIYVPLPARATWSDAERVATTIASDVASAHPRETTLQRTVSARGASTVYVDAGQNARGKTVAAPYGVRARPGATVSTPLAWSELSPALDPREFTVRTLPARIERAGDLWGPAIRKRNSARIVTRL